jgi:hypothetical protein
VEAEQASTATAPMGWVEVVLDGLTLLAATAATAS